MKENTSSRNPTIKDVAREAGVGTTPVNRYFDLRMRMSLRPQTREKIEQAIASLGYKHTPRIRRKSKGEAKKYLFGLLTSLSKDVFNSRYHTGILSGVFDRIGQTSHELKFFLLKDRHYERLEEVLFQHAIDGLMILTWRIHPNLVRLVEQSSGEVPLVVFNDYDPKLKVNILYTDVKEGIRQAVFYLLEKGYETIGMLGGPSEILFHDKNETLRVPSIDAKEKLTGFLEAFKEKRISIAKNMIHECPSYREGDGYLEMKKWIKKGNLPRALIAANDEIALGAMRALKESRLWCPDSVALVGFDDIEKAKLVSPSLTTIRQPLYQMGQDAVDILIEKMQSPGKEPVQRRYVPELIIRQTA